MKFKFIYLPIIALVILAAAVFTLPGKKLADKNCSEIKGEATVTMKTDSFDPETLTIQKCTKVTFVNQDTVSRWPASNLHPTHGIYPEFDPLKPVEAGKEWSFVFDKVGNWKYHDHLIPSLRGTIAVSE